jgi:uncharacterized protein with HEPN domain
MKEELRDNGRLQHIIVAIKNIYEFVEGISFEEYCSNTIMKFAVIKNLEIVGQDSCKLSKEFKTQHAEINWKDITKMRRILPVNSNSAITDEKI